MFFYHFYFTKKKKVNQLIVEYNFIQMATSTGPACCYCSSCQTNFADVYGRRFWARFEHYCEKYCV